MSKLGMKATVGWLRGGLSMGAILVLAACGGPHPASAPAPRPSAGAQRPDTARKFGLPRTDTSAGQVVPRAAFATDLDTVHAGKFDQGKMWTFEFPPIKYFTQTYGFHPDSMWFVNARLGALRISGCSASFVSPNGLILTNHHCARPYEAGVQKPGEDILDNGFFAKNLADERPVKDFHADQLVDLIDVTNEVNAKVDTVPMDRRQDVRKAVLDSLKEKILAQHQNKDSSIVVQMVSLYNGGRTSAYIFHRYKNVKLVAVPELQIGYFGGDYDNFTYPRYNLDFSMFRVYGPDGKPLHTPHYFKVDTAALKDGEPIFVVGNPGSTSRLQTVAQLEFRRDIGDKDILDLLRSRMAVLDSFMKAHPDVAKKRDLETSYFELSNSEKAYTGQLKGLDDPAIIARRADAERQFQDSIEADSTLNAKYGKLIAKMAALQKERRTDSAGFGAFIGLTSNDIASATLHRALIAFQIINVRAGAGDQKTLEKLEAQMDSVPQQPAALDEALMTQRFKDFVHYYGANSQLVQAVLGGSSPQDVAAAVVSASVLADSAQAATMAASGNLSMSDPALGIVRAYLPTFGRFQQMVAKVFPQEDAIAAELGRARFAVYGTSVPPDATFSLRIQDGVVKGYPYNGTIAPWHTTFYGLYNRHYSFSGRKDWALPKRWLNPPAAFNLATPLDFVSTADIIGGNSGSPVLNKNLQLVGLIFDGNIESLTGDYIYMPKLNRAVAVDVHAILAALDHIYGMQRIVEEMETGKLVPTEAAAAKMN